MNSISLQELAASCRVERNAHRQHGETRSPACVEIVRRAFGGDNDAWTIIFTMFEGLVVAWGHRVADWCLLNDYDDISEAIQQGWTDFSIKAPRQLDLDSDESLGKVLAYLQTCVKYAVLHERRRRRPLRLATIDDIDDQHVQELQVPAPELTEQHIEEKSMVEQVLQRIQNILHDEREHRLFVCRWILQLKSQEIAARYPDIFTDVEHVYQVTRNIDRRILKDAELQRLREDLYPLRRKDDESGTHRIEILNQWEVIPMETDCSLEVSALLDYILGVASPEARAVIEGSPACLGATQRLALALQPFLLVLFRVQCPDIETLVAYQARKLSETEQLVVWRHTVDCPACQEELDLLVAIDAVPLVSPPNVIRRLVAAAFQSPLGLPHPVRGGGIYKTSHVQIDISTERVPGQPRAWTLSGEVRTGDGLPMRNLVEQVVVESLDDISLVDYPATVDADGTFVLAELSAGLYRLRILTPDEEIVIRRISIGETV